MLVMFELKVQGKDLRAQLRSGSWKAAPLLKHVSRTAEDDGTKVLGESPSPGEEAVQLCSPKGPCRYMVYT